MPTLTRRFDEAFVYAHETHGEHTRKGTGVPYLGHLMGVASIVLDDGGTEDEAIAALLHDAAEDHGGRERLEDIRARFGGAVARLVGNTEAAVARTQAGLHPARPRPRGAQPPRVGRRQGAQHVRHPARSAEY